MTGRSERSARALCDGADVVREAIGNCVFVRILLYVPNIKMQRRLRSGSVHNFGTCAWRPNARRQNPEKKRVSTQEQLDFAMALRFSKRKY